MSDIPFLPADEARKQLKELTGLDYVSIPEISGLREWMSPDQLKGLSDDGPATRLQLNAMLSAARAAYSKGFCDGQNAHGVAVAHAKLDDRQLFEIVCQKCHVSVGVMVKALAAKAMADHVAASPGCAGTVFGYNTR